MSGFKIFGHYGQELTPPDPAPTPAALELANAALVIRNRELSDALQRLMDNSGHSMTCFMQPVGSLCTCGYTREYIAAKKLLAREAKDL